MTGNTIDSITLGWVNPTDADLAHVVIRRAGGSTPPAADQGTLVATLGTTKTSYTDKNLTSASTYSYALFAEDKAGNQSSAATVTVFTAATDTHTGLRGTLTDAQGRGIGNVLVHVRLSNADAADAVTSSTGTYTVTNLVAGTYTVCFEPKSNVGGRSATGYLAGCYHQQPAGYGSQPTPVTVTAGAMTSHVDDTLAIAGAISGRVTGPDGSPVAGVLLSTYVYQAQQDFTVLSAADGSYLMKNLPPNQDYTFCYRTDQATGSSTGYLPGCDYNNYAYVTAGQITVSNHTLDIGGIVTGTVRDRAGNPVAGVTVESLDISIPAVVTDSTGRYQITGLSSNTYYLCADGSSLPASDSAPYGYLNSCYYLPNAQLYVQVDQTYTQDLTVAQYGAMGGTLTRSDGTPAANASVQIFGIEGYADSFVQTDAQGHWQSREWPGQQYYACYQQYDTTDVWTCHSGHPWDGGVPTDSDPISVSEGVLTVVNDALLAGGTISGTVTGADGAPLSDVVVNVDELTGQGSAQVFTDSTGHYSATGLPAGSYRVCFGVDAASRQPSSPGYPWQCYGGSAADPYPYSLQVAIGQQVVADDQLALGAAIAGRVTDAAGNPLASVWVQLVDLATNQTYQTNTDSDGKYGFYQLNAGNFSVCFDATYVDSPPSGGYVATCWHDQLPQRPADPVQAPAGVITGGIDARMLVGGTITGRVIDSAGNPISEAIVRVVYADGTEITSGYNYLPDGGYQFSGLPAVPVAVCVEPLWWQPYQAGCYANAADFHTATMLTPASGTTLSGIDIQLLDSTAPMASVNRPGISALATRAA